MFKKELKYNKRCAVLMLILAIASIKIGGDATFFVFTLPICMMLFFAKNNCIHR